MDSWTSQNNPTKQTLLSFGTFIVGLLLVVGFRDFALADGNALAGFLGGIFLLIMGAVGFLMSGKQTVVVDPRARRIVVEDTNRLRTKRRSIAFSDVVDIRIGYLGKRSNYVNFYSLVLELKSGEEFPLFGPGQFHEGGSDRSAMEDRRRRLEEYLKQ